MSSPSRTRSPGRSGPIPSGTGPRGASPKRKGGRKKKSRRALAAEAARLAEEARILEEEERKKKEEEEKKRAEEEAKRAAEERARIEEENRRLGEQKDADADVVRDRTMTITKLEAEVEDQKEWVKYLECNPLPDVTHVSELNTYLSTWRNDEPEPRPPPHLALVPTLHAAQLTEQLITMLATPLGIARSESRDNDVKWHLEYMATLRDVSINKLDQLTISFLHKADEYEDKDDKVVSTCDSVPDIKYGLWVRTGGDSQGTRVKTKPVEFKKINVVLELPFVIQRSRAAIRVLQTTFDLVSCKVKETKENQTTTNMLPLYVRHTSVGGVILVQQLAMPPPPKKAKGWTMREITPLTHAIQVVPYPAATDPNAPAAASQTQHITVSYQIPTGVYLADDKKPTLGWWDAKNETWQRDGITPLKWDSVSRIIVFQMALLKPIALIQPRALDFPYRYWNITPTGPDSCLLVLAGARLELELEIVAGQVRLLSPLHPVLEPFRTFMPPGLLLTRMARCGINVIPTIEDAQFCRKPMKLPQLERALHSQVATIAGVFEMTGSAWNSSRGSEQCLFQLRAKRVITREVPVVVEEKKDDTLDNQPEEKKELTGADLLRELEEEELLSARRNEDRRRAAADAERREHEEARRIAIANGTPLPPDLPTSNGTATKPPAKAATRAVPAKVAAKRSGTITTAAPAAGGTRTRGAAVPAKAGAKAKAAAKKAAAAEAAAKAIADAEELAKKEAEAAAAAAAAAIPVMAPGQAGPGSGYEWFSVLAREEKFVVVKATDKILSIEPVANRISHVSLRRALDEHCTSLMPPTVSMPLSFRAADDTRDQLLMQQTVMRMLNLVRVFTFY